MGVLRFDPALCSGCWACTMTCADENDLVMECGGNALRLVSPVEKNHDGLWTYSYKMRGCMHCEDPECMSACPCDCFSISENGLVSLERSACVGCGLCAEACPFDAIIIKEGKASKCDGCGERVSEGLRPACEKICPTGAIRFEFKNSK